MPALAILGDALHALERPRGAVSGFRPFVTISRQSATGADSLPARLALRLNHDESGDWSVWDHPLVEKVSAECGIAQRIIDLMIEQPDNWLQELADGYVIGQERCNAQEFCVYKRVSIAIRGLATAGNAIIVGRGGMFVTHGMPNGIRIRVIAPMDYRIRRLAEEQGVSPREAADRIAAADHNRDVFFHRYWPGKVLTPEAFSLTFNAAEMSVDDMVESIVPAIHARESSRRKQGFLRLA
jgi:cytidylate kinase